MAVDSLLSKQENSELESHAESIGYTIIDAAIKEYPLRNISKPNKPYSNFYVDIMSLNKTTNYASILHGLFAHMVSNNREDVNKENVREKFFEDLEKRISLGYFDIDTTSKIAIIENLIETTKYEYMNVAYIDTIQRNKQIMWQYYGLGTEKKSLNEIGKAYGICAERVRQIKNNVLTKISKNPTSLSLQYIVGYSESEMHKKISEIQIEPPRKPEPRSNLYSTGLPIFAIGVLMRNPNNIKSIEELLNTPLIRIKKTRQIGPKFFALIEQYIQSHKQPN